MRLVYKIAMGLAAGMYLVLGAHLLVSTRHQIDVYESDLARDGELLAHVMAAAFSVQTELQGHASAMGFLREVDARDADVGIRFVNLDGDSLASERPLSDGARHAGLAAGETIAIDVDTEAGASLVTYFRLGGGGAIEISASLARRRVFVRNSIYWALGALAIGLVMTAGIAFAVGSLWIGRPIRALLEKVQRVSEGDLDSPVTLPGRDELGALGDALNDMSGALSRSGEEVDRKHGELLAAEWQLRHAERLAMVGQLASGVAHELGTPLNVISGHAKLISSDESGAQSGNSAEVIHEQVDRMARIIRQLLDFARREGPHEHAARVDIAALVERTATLLRGLQGASNIDTSIDNSVAGLAVSGDASELEQVLINLGVNGLQAMPGGGSLRLGVDVVRATPKDGNEATAGDYVCVSVSDTGAGIAPEHLARLFEPFFTTKGVGEGTGLGLSVSHGIVRDHDGWVEVETELGRGSRFVVYLPRATA